MSSASANPRFIARSDESAVRSERLQTSLGQGPAGRRQISVEQTLADVTAAYLETSRRPTSRALGGVSQLYRSTKHAVAAPPPVFDGLP